MPYSGPGAQPEWRLGQSALLLGLAEPLPAVLLDGAALLLLGAALLVSGSALALWLGVGSGESVGLGGGVLGAGLDVVGFGVGV
ncbi:hypothetical protein, partial [Micromonospora sp. BL1]|uniref:hypothetical protein n=1 Tax=Micromonospora sp. BL1 TaxID=2478709 RepID=UPI0018F5A6B4